MYDHLDRAQLIARLTQAEAELASLRTTARGYGAALDTLEQGVFIHAPDGTLVDCNEHACTQLNLPRNSVIGMNGAAIIRALSASQAPDEGENPIDLAIRTHQPIHHPLQAVLPCAGHPAPSSLCAIPLLHEDGTVEAIALTLAPATEPRFDALLTNLDCIAVQGYDEDRRVIYWNRASEQRYGYQRDEACGRRIDELLLRPDDHADFVEDFAEQLARPGQPSDATTLLRHKDGKLLEVFSSQVSVALPDGRRELFRFDLDQSEIQDLRQELAHYYARLRAITEASALGIIGTDNDGIVNYANVTFQRLTGRSAGELLGRPWHADLYLNDLPVALEAWTIALGQNSHAGIEVRYLKPDNTSCWLRFNTGQLNEDGRLAGLIATVEDITSRKLIEQALQESVEKFETAFRLMPDLIILTDIATGTVLDVNQQILPMAGYRRDEVVGQTTMALGLWGNADDRLQLLQDLQHQREVRARELPLCRKDGQISWIEFSASISQMGGRQTLISVLRDISDRRQMEAELRDSQERFAKVFELIPELITFTDLQTGTFIDTNLQLEPLLGYTADQIKGKTALGLGIWVNVEQRQELIELMRSRREARLMEVQLRRKDGRIIWCELSAVPCEQGGRRLMMAVMRDITERREIQHELRELTIRLEQRVTERTRELQSAMESLQKAQDDLIHSEKLASLGSLVAGVAHELNTPIGNSVTVATTLHEKTRLLSTELAGGTLKRSSLQGYVDTANTAVDLLMRNLESARELIASFKQVAVDQTSEKRRRFDLREVIEEVMVTIAPRFKNSPHRMALDLQPHIEMDSFPGPLGQVLTNLVNNALVHAFEHREHGQVLIHAQQSGTQAIVVIRDDGAGIPADHLNKIWDPFFTTKLGRGGSGLGLNIVHGIVTRILGGKIAVATKIGEGTTFTLSLPLCAPDSTEVATSAE
ncbi:PAS domain S-box protein [Chitinivorax sp. PXF-14]|uniref:PAS domain S-box protein n=1 Tax=Chitinivorax sp. PXF-14 TaxID=3230488 RepID=UPI003467DBAA